MQSFLLLQTIIECLKLSCTGELPPNARSGHSFIHDPKVIYNPSLTLFLTKYSINPLFLLSGKVAGETETKGQIKLRFKTAAGKDVVCVRSFQLTQKASKMEYKAIESVLQTINPHTGEVLHFLTFFYFFTLFPLTHLLFSVRKFASAIDALTWIERFLRSWVFPRPFSKTLYSFTKMKPTGLYRILPP